MDDERLLHRVKTIFEDEISSVEFIKSGWSNVVLDINQSHIFRFNRFHSHQFEVEKAFLVSAASQLSIQIPRPIYSGQDFIAYPRIPGERFDPKKFSQLSHASQIKILEQLGRFLSQLHQLEFQHPHLSTEPYGGGDFWQELWPLVAPHLTKTGESKARAFFESGLSKLNAASIPIVLTHSDLGTNNLLVDFEESSLQGIIDFSDLTIGDPAVDFAGFYRNFGKPFVEQLLNFYKPPLGDLFWLRVQLSSLKKQFFVVYFAKKHQYDSAIPAVIKNIERLIEVEIS